MQDLQVKLGQRSYPILIGADLLSNFDEHLRSTLPQLTHAIVIYDEHVQAYADQVKGGVQDCKARCSTISVSSGESSKSIDKLSSIWNQMLEEKTDRSSLVIAVGGGVVGDLAGFAAASYARGLRFVQVPTTLLAQVDSSVGGKTGINLPGAKNMVGAFWQPQLVVIDTATLKSLPRREFLSGLAEVVKVGVIVDCDLFSMLEAHAEEIANNNDAAHVERIIRRSCQAKADVVAADEREVSGRRAILNYGHTFAHAIEKVAGYGHYLHGEAVSIGMQMAAKLARQLGRIDDGFVARQTDLLQRLQLPTTMPEANFEEYWQAMQSDKKVAAGHLRFILPSRLGHVDLVDGVTKDQAADAFTQCLV